MSRSRGWTVEDKMYAYIAIWLRCLSS